MTFGEKVELLKQYKAAVRLSEYYRGEVKRYKELKQQVSVQKLDDMPRAKGTQTDLSDYIVKLEEMEHNMYSKLIDAERIKANIIVWCEEIKDVDERLVIKYHYLQEHNYGWIADTMHYESEKTVQRKHRNAVHNLPDPDRNKWVGSFNFDKNVL